MEGKEGLVDVNGVVRKLVVFDVILVLVNCYCDILLVKVLFSLPNDVYSFRYKCRIMCFCYHWFLCIVIFTGKFFMIAFLLYHSKSDILRTRIKV